MRYIFDLTILIINDYFQAFYVIYLMCLFNLNKSKSKNPYVQENYISNVFSQIHTLTTGKNERSCIAMVSFK